MGTRMPWPARFPRERLDQMWRFCLASGVFHWAVARRIQPAPTSAARGLKPPRHDVVKSALVCRWSVAPAETLTGILDVTMEHEKAVGVAVRVGKVELASL
jgi:hypothetical protein